MKIRTSFVAVAIACCALAAPGLVSAEEPWVGTYSLKLPDELAKQITDAGGALPTLDVTLKADGTFGSTGVEGEREWTGKGSYTVQGTTVTMTEEERDGKSVTEEAMVFEAGDGFAVLSGNSQGMPMSFVRKD